MKLFTNSKPDHRTGRAEGHSPSVDTALDAQTRPVRFQHAGGSAQLKIDAAYSIGHTLIVAGWCSVAAESVGLQLVQNGQPLHTQKLTVPRQDVAQHLGLTQGDLLGFALIATHHDTQQPVRLSWVGEATEHGVRTPPLHVQQVQSAETVQPADLGALGSAALLFAQSLPPLSPAWQSLVAAIPPIKEPCPNAKGFIEGALASPLEHDGLIFGWALHQDPAALWIEDDAGHLWSLKHAYRHFRTDIENNLELSAGHDVHTSSAFILRAPGLRPQATLRFKALSLQGVHTLSQQTARPLPVDAVAAAKVLFGLTSPQSEFHQRVHTLDQPLLAPLLAQRTAQWAHLPVVQHTLGLPPATPKVSVIVPLYGRIDFVEHQLLSFSNDPWLREHAELIYVLDDPRQLEALTLQAQAWFRLYHQPLRWVWGGTNRGYSGANNLGASLARGEHLLFLNSDAFAQRPGWLPALLAVLEQHPDIGAVGPRLLFADGSIQHAGMTFVRREEWGVWVNHHPCMGLDPALDPHRDLTRVPAVTGACLAMRRRDFERVGGWDTGYLIGDFEDSDLCLKLKAHGLSSAYLPEVELTHLERQSFRLLGQDSFRQRVVLFNAIRHQQRWAESLSAQEF